MVGEYRQANRDLWHLTDSELQQHYLEHGRIEGRRANRLLNRRDFADLATLVATRKEILEISPFFSPLVPGAQTCDVLEFDHLVQRAQAAGGSEAKVRRPDYIIRPDEGLTTITRTFDAVVSSHVAEHVPDFAGHLIQVRDLLRPGGRYFALLPDSRYCFDHFIPPSTVAEMVVAHIEGHVRHSLRSVVEHRALTTHNDASRHWQGDHGEPLQDIQDRLRAAVEEYESVGPTDYLDVHGWQFTPDTFVASVEALDRIWGHGLHLERCYHTRRDSNEFWVILRRHQTDSPRHHQNASDQARR